MFAASADPWGYRSSEYERDKYAATLGALDGRRFARALEVGPANGIFTAQLAERCEELVAIDYSPRALALAARQLRGREHVELVRASFPEEVPDGAWDLVVCSEILYYLDRYTFALALSWLREALVGGASVLAVSWRGPGTTEPLRGDWVHDRLASELFHWHVLDGRTAGYRLDRFEPDGL
jgi:ubiquinone/menaquinone biosynthesis C-methylase UbiE